MNDLRFVTHEGEPNQVEMKALIDGLLSHHASKGHPRKSKKFSILLKDKNSCVFGGIIASFLWNGMEINSLWVDEKVRKQGWGKKLMTAVEEEAIKRGCTFAYTNTFSWQAPEFYIKLGYTFYGKLDDFPEGNSLSYYLKKLK
ncbi:GNAT family N-acetyltransferase [Candidatus Roizmanbacteria bacterium]|nr:GNAT family N-acetyltransferase [Candidatus Roizmanbacteria bacterium]